MRNRTGAVCYTMLAAALPAPYPSMPPIRIAPNLADGVYRSGANTHEHAAGQAHSAR